MWMDVDTALVGVPVNLLPLVVVSDFIAIDDGVTYDEAGMDLNWNFTTTAGVTTQTNVVPTTAGDYDWASLGNGMYTIEMTATGGASANNDTEGFGWFTGKATAVLAWRGPTIGFRAAALNNALIDGGDVLDVSLTEIGGDAQSATDLKDFADAGYDPSVDKVNGVVLVDTTTTNSDMVAAAPTAAAVVNEWESQSQADPTGFHVNLLEIAGDAQSLTDLKDFADAGYDPSVDKVNGVVLVDTTTTNSDMVAAAPTAAAVVNEWESQSQADPTGFHVNLLEIAGDGQSVTDLKDFADAGYDPSTDKVNGVKLVDTTTTNSDMVGTNSAALASVWTAARAGALTDWIDGGRLDLLLDAITAAGPTKTQMDTAHALLTTAAVWTAARAGALTDWINGGRLDLIIDAILADTNELQGDDVPTLIAALPTANENADAWGIRSPSDVEDSAPHGSNAQAMARIGGTHKVTLTDDGGNTGTMKLYKADGTTQWGSDGGVTTAASGDVVTGVEDTQA